MTPAFNMQVRLRHELDVRARTVKKRPTLLSQSREKVLGRTLVIKLNLAIILQAPNAPVPLRHELDVRVRAVFLPRFARQQMLPQFYPDSLSVLITPM